MSPALSAPDLDRLGKLCGMFGSAHDGERASAALKADALLRDRGVSWVDLVGSLKAAAAPSPRSASVIPHRQDALECLARRGIWTKQELDFLTNISRRRKLPSPAQAAWLADLLHRARFERAAA